MFGVWLYLFVGAVFAMTLFVVANHLLKSGRFENKEWRMAFSNPKLGITFMVSYTIAWPLFAMIMLWPFVKYLKEGRQ